MKRALTVIVGLLAIFGCLCLLALLNSVPDEPTYRPAAKPVSSPAVQAVRRWT